LRWGLANFYLFIYLFIYSFIHSFCLGWPGTFILPTQPPKELGMTGTYHSAQLLVKMGYQKPFAQADLIL
jgi:hypothetical protein